ncbi:P-loop NTPase family protein [Actinomadura rudentiformis]|uniref:ParA family protein n=1 Tax=Actinomadura rudentiformis TaxID=359158 RepID=A0A6H9YSA4_9ACTN|nr:hypothetical protein [Actinomadura rudentiformis]KAB2346888.1 ParA family protein [Actinomadura rudentiformis]
MEIVFGNQESKFGKTTSTISLVASFGLRGAGPLIVDVDAAFHAEVPQQVDLPPSLHRRLAMLDIDSEGCDS